MKARSEHQTLSKRVFYGGRRLENMKYFEGTMSMERDRNNRSGC